jgi:hypothetical protein
MTRVVTPLLILAATLVAGGCRERDEELTRVHEQCYELHRLYKEDVLVYEEFTRWGTYLDPQPAHLDSCVSIWYDSGIRKRLVHYVNGKMYEANLWYPDGTQEFYLLRSLDGTVQRVVSYYENGSVKDEGVQISKSDFRLTEYNQDGDIRASGTFRNEQPWDGTFYFEDEDELTEFENGRLIRGNYNPPADIDIESHMRAL